MTANTADDRARNRRRPFSFSMRDPAPVEFNRKERILKSGPNFRQDRVLARHNLVAALTDLDPDDLLDPSVLETLAPSAVKVSLADGEQKSQDMRIGG